MNKSSKKARRARTESAQRGKRRLRSLAIFLLVVAGAMSAGSWWWNARPVASHSPFERLIGRWQRPDGGYVLEIKSVASGGAMDAAYFNPQSIHVGKAEASKEADATRVFIELRDVNYPGSTYTLAYEPASDRLKGIYYQAIDRQHFPVAFVRTK